MADENEIVDTEAPPEEAQVITISLNPEHTQQHLTQKLALYLKHTLGLEVAYHIPVDNLQEAPQKPLRTDLFGDSEDEDDIGYQAQVSSPRVLWAMTAVLCSR